MEYIENNFISVIFYNKCIQCLISEITILKDGSQL